MTSSSTGEVGWSKFSISHLLPSSSFFGSFFGSLRCEALLLCRMLGGLGLISGPGLRERLMSVEEAEADVASFSGTVLPARREGFLCVICELSTFFSPEVTDSPLFSCSKTEPMSPGPPFCVDTLVELDDGVCALSKFGSGGGGGGGATAPDEGVAPLVVGDESNSASRYARTASMVPLLFQVTPLG